jgi:hypothetical protein
LIKQGGESWIKPEILADSLDNLPASMKSVIWELWASVSAGASCRLSHGNQFDPRDKIVSLEASTINNLDWILLNLDLPSYLLLQFYAQGGGVNVLYATV